MTKALLVLLAAVAFPLHAETQPLTFEEGVRLAAEHNRDLRRAEANRAAAEAQRRGAGSGYRPQVSASVGYSESNGSGADAEGYSTALTATQNLFAGFADQARVQQGDAGLEASEAALATAKAQLSHDLKVAYSGLLYAQDNVVLTNSILQRLEENLRLVELRFEGGRENKGSYLLTQASVEQARVDVLQAEQELIAARAQLGRALGDIAADWRARGTVPLVPAPPTPDFPALARETPRLREAAARQFGAEAAVRLARSSFYPSVDLRGTLGRSGDHWSPSTERNSVGATVSIPLYSGGRNYYGERDALAALDAAKADRDAVEQQLIVDLKRRYAAYVQSVGRLKVDSDFLAAAETRARIARARYQNGLISFEDWDQIETDLIARQKASLVVQRDRVAAEAAWELEQGKGVIP
jgi:outer membrane protein